MPRRKATIDVQQLAALLGAAKPKSAKRVAVGKEKAKTNPWLIYLRQYRAPYKAATGKSDEQALKDLAVYYRQQIAPPMGGYSAAPLEMNVMGSGRRGLVRR